MSGHPVFEKVHRLAVQLKDDQTAEKFELCDAIAGLLNNIAQDGGYSHLEAPEADSLLFRTSLREILQSKLSTDFRRKALNLCAALFELYSASWLDTSSDSQMLLTIMTHIASIELRVSLAKKDSFKAVEAFCDPIVLCSCLRVIHGSIYRLTNDPGETQWEPEKILSLQKCYNSLMQELCEFVNRVVVEEEYETNRELRQFLCIACETITFWCLNDLDSLQKITRPLLVRITPLCEKLRWTQATLNLVARLDLEPDPSNSDLVSQIWDNNESLMTFTLQTFSNQLPTLKMQQDRRLILVAHFIFHEFDSLLVGDTRDFLSSMARHLGEFMISKGEFGPFEAQGMLHLAALVAKLCHANAEDTTPFKVALACSTQMLWSFCGFNKNNRSNTFKMPGVYKRMGEDLAGLIDLWCDAVQCISALVTKHQFATRFLLEHGIPQRALTVPLVGTLEMPEPIEVALQEFHNAVTTSCPDVKELLDRQQEDLLLGEEFNDM